MPTRNIFIITIAGTHVCKKQAFSFIATYGKSGILRTNVLASAKRFTNEIEALHLAETLRAEYGFLDPQVVRISR
jgi:hypothetical protein